MAKFGDLFDGWAAMFTNGMMPNKQTVQMLMYIHKDFITSGAFWVFSV